MNAIFGPKCYHFFIQRPLISEQPLYNERFSRSRRCSLHGGFTVYDLDSDVFIQYTYIYDLFMNLICDNNRKKKEIKRRPSVSQLFV